MWKAIWWKEWRETAWFLAVAAVLVFHSVGSQCGWSPLSAFDIFGFSQYDTWVLSDRREFSFMGETPPMLSVVAIACFGIGLGLWQTLTESSRQTWLFLLHRPVSRGQLILAKWTFGAVCLAVLVSLGLLVGLWLSARPGARPAPFEWVGVIPWWQVFLTTTLFYSAAFLTGLRPANWRGSRLLPLFSVFGLTFVFSIDTPPAWWWCGLMTVLLLAIHFVFLSLSITAAATRDYP